MDDRFKMLVMDDFHRPTECKVCKGIMISRGIGEYQCEDCGKVDYDDYGKVRNYLERCKGANVTEIAAYTGVSHKKIREMVKESRFEVVDERIGYVKCESCGVNIKSGRLCQSCEMIYHRKIEEEARSMRKHTIESGSVVVTEATGSKRFTRKDKEK